MQACLLTVPKYFQQIMGFLKKNFEVEVTCSTVCSSLLRTVLNVFQLLYATGCCSVEVACALLIIHNIKNSFKMFFKYCKNVTYNNFFI